MRKLHFAWFGTPGPGYWNLPSAALYDWRKPELYQDIARLCERAKFDLTLFADTPAIPNLYRGSNDEYVRRGFKITPDPVPILTMMAAATTRLGLGTTLSTSFYPPFLLARMMGTLSHLTGNRVAWNVVTSASRIAARNYGQDDLVEHDTRYDMADEYLDLVRQLWDSWAPDAVVEDHATGVFADPAKVKAINFTGRYYKSTGPLNVVAPPDGHPVVIMAGTSPRGQRFAVENADVVIAHKNTVEDMRAYTERLRAQLTGAGRDPASCKVFFSIKPVLGDTPAIAQERWAQNMEEADPEIGLMDLSSTLGFDMSQFDLDQPLPKDLPVQAIAGKLLQYTGAGKSMTVREIAKHEAMHETFPICGTPEHVADIIEQTARDGGADGFHFRTAFGDIQYLTEIATKLMPVLQRRGLARTEYGGTTLRDHLFEF